MPPERTMIFVDGENLAFRYAEMLRSGRRPHADNAVDDGCFVWNSRILRKHLWNIRRIAYYTSVVGDDLRVRNVKERIAGTGYTCTTDRNTQVASTRTGQLVPYVKKKAAASRKESVCDIAIAVDVMRACYRDQTDIVWLFSGDGDFGHLLTEVMHSGKVAYVSALSSGLNDDLRICVDEFLPIDDCFFEPLGLDATAPTDPSKPVSSA